MFKPTTLIVLSLIISLSFGCQVIEQKANGEVSARTSSSYLVLIEGFIGYNKMYLCSGVLISQKYVLATRSCIFGVDFVNLHIYANKLRDEYEESRSIYRSDVFLYPDDFDGLNQVGNIALIKMPSSFVSRADIDFAKIPTMDIAFSVTGKTYGWGLLDYKDLHAATYKQELTLVKTTLAECQAAYPELDWANGEKGRNCVKTNVSTRTNCVSDDGSPFILDGTVFGLQSGEKSQIKSCNENHPNLVQNVYHYREWILKNAELQ